MPDEVKALQNGLPSETTNLQNGMPDGTTNYRMECPMERKIYKMERLVECFSPTVDAKMKGDFADSNVKTQQQPVA